MKKRTVQITVVIAIIIILALLFVLKRASTAAELSQPVLPATAQTAAPAAASQPEAEGVQTAAAAEESLQPEEDSASQEYAEPEPLFVSQIDEEALRSSGQPVMIQFFSTTCVPCMSMMDDLRAFYSENYGSVRVVALNIGEYPEAAMSYPVSVIPTQDNRICRKLRAVHLPRYRRTCICRPSGCAHKEPDGAHCGRCREE